MSKIEEFYNALVKDPDLEIKAGQTRSQAARTEATYRARQYDNNAEALALATKPAESPINSLLDHVQVNKSYRDTALIKFGGLFSRKKKEKSTPVDTTSFTRAQKVSFNVSRYQSILDDANKDEEPDNPIRDEQYAQETKDLIDAAKNERTRSKNFTGYLKEVNADLKEMSDLRKKKQALKKGTRLSLDDQALEQKHKQWTIGNYKKDKWSKVVKGVMNPNLLQSKFQGQLDNSRAAYKLYGDMAKQFKDTKAVQRHIKANSTNEKVQETVKVTEATNPLTTKEESAVDKFKKVINQSSNKNVDASVDENESEDAKEGSSESEKLEASEKRADELRNHMDVLNTAIREHEENRPAYNSTQPDIDESKVDEDGLLIVPEEEEESEESYNARPDVKAWQSRLDHMNEISEATHSRLKQEVAGTVTKGVDDSLQLGKPTKEEAASEKPLSIDNFSEKVVDNIEGGAATLQDHINNARGLYRDDQGQFNIEKDPSGPLYDEEEGRPMTLDESNKVFSDEIKPNTEDGGKLGRGTVPKGNLDIISKEYEKRFNKPLTFDMKDGKPDVEADLYRALERAGVFHHDNQPITDKDGNEVPVGKGTDYHKQQSKFGKGRFVPNKKDNSITSDKTNASIDDIYDHINRVVDNQDLYLKSTRGELDELGLAARDAYMKEQSPENEARYRAAVERRNVDMPREQHQNWDTVKKDTDKQIKQPTQTTPEPEQTGGGDTPEQSPSKTSKKRDTPHYTVKRHLGDRYQELLDNGELHNEDDTPKSIRQVEQDFPKEKDSTPETPVESKGPSAMDEIKQHMTDKGYSEEAVNGMQEAGLFDKDGTPYTVSAIEDFHNEGRFNEHFEENNITPLGEAAKVKPDDKPENKPVPDDVKKYMADKGHSDDQISDMEDKGLLHPDGKRTNPPHTLEDITDIYDNQDTFNEYKDPQPPESEVDPAIQIQLDKAKDEKLIQHAYEKEFGLEEGAEDDFYKLEDYTKDFMEEHSKKSLSQVNKKLAQINKSKREFTAKQEQAKAAEPKQSPEEKAEAKEKQQMADTSPIPHNELMKTDKSQKTAEMHAVAIDRHLKDHGEKMSPQAKANLEHAKTENDKQIHPSTRSHMEREKKILKDKYGGDEHLAELKQQHLDDQHETHMAESEDPAHQSHRDEQGAKSKANEYITSVGKRSEHEKDSPDIYGEHSVESDKDGKISSKDHPLSGDRKSSKLRSPADEEKQGDGPPNPDVARRKLTEGYVWHKETRHWILKETLQEQHGGMGGFSGGLMNGHAKNAAGKNIFENEHGEAGSGGFHLSGGNTPKLGHVLGG